MAVTRNAPNTVFLGGERIQVGDLAVSEVIVPGMLVERALVGNVFRWKKASAAAAEAAVATNQSMLNKGVDDVYNIGDLAEVSILQSGGTAWMIVPSGANIAAGAQLGSNGDGRLKTGATVALFTALESVNATTGDSRIRVERN